MAFDVRQLATMIGSTNPLEALGTTFGMPSCLLNLTSAALALLPSPMLAYISQMADEAAAKANEFYAELFNYVEDKLGIISFDSENGFFTFGSDSSLGGINSAFAAIGGMVGAMSAALSAGAQLYNNVNQTISQVEGIIDCLNSFLNGPGGPFAATPPEDSDYKDLAAQEFARWRAQLEAVAAAIADINRLQNIITEEQDNRANGRSEEPTVLDPALSAFGFAVADEATQQREVFRLVFGPPRSSQGQYLLSVDGLFYDSQSGAEYLTPILLNLTNKNALVEASKRWKFDYDPNIGGKGDQLSSKSFSKWINTVFDINIIDNGLDIQQHYKKDHFLQTLIGNKEKRILDLSQYIKELESNPGSSKAIIDNFKQSLISEVAYHEDKINRRKKQIEIGVKAYGLFGKGRGFEPGTVPINNFSYLEDCNISLALNTQKQLTFRQDEVSGVILPLQPIFAVSKPKDGLTAELDYLNVPMIGTGSIIVDSSGTSDASAAELSISDVVTTDKLFAIYNYLNSTIVKPESEEFQVLNCISPDDYNNAQLVSTDQSSVFDLGLATAYLTGITKNNGITLSGVGNYVKLPDTSEFQDWLYDPNGASLQTWIYAPDLSSNSAWFNNDASSLYRLVLACENTGSSPTATRNVDILSVSPTNLSEYARGLIMGFTRDTRWTKGYMPSNEVGGEEGYNEASSYGFLIAPTISYDQSSIAFINKDCSFNDGQLGMFISRNVATQSGKTLDNISKEFTDLAITLDYKKDNISVLIDGEVLMSSSISESFGSPYAAPLKLPSIKFENSFEYDVATVGPSAPIELKRGPKLYRYFTPWILGGGYTDGMALTGNFLGGEYGGVTSGLKGYLGSTKFYSKPLKASEIEFNYSIQQKLYKNIVLD